MQKPNNETLDRVSTGVPGMDDILGGGYLPDSATLVRGPPGSGKSIFTLHYLAAGVAGESLPELRGILTGTPDWPDDPGDTDTPRSS
jgi:RecA/RadA recombinase